MRMSLSTRHRSSVTKHLAGWLLIPVFAALNGALRDATYGRLLDATLAHSLASLPVAIGILAWARWLSHRYRLPSERAALSVGVAWAALTIVAELSLGAFRGISMTTMLREYDVSSGHLWALIPLTSAFAPYLALRRQTLEPVRHRAWAR